MSSIEEKVRKLKEVEAQELARIKEKRFLEEAVIKQETEKKAIARLMCQLKEEKESLEKELQQVRKKNFSLKLETESWAKVAKRKSEELKEAEDNLNAKHEKIWKGRDDFCDEADKFIDEYGLLSKWWKEQIKIINDPHHFKNCIRLKEEIRNEREKEVEEIRRLEEEIMQLENDIEKEEVEKLENEEELDKLENEKEGLLNEINGPEFSSIKNSIDCLEKRCTELSKLIADEKKALEKFNMSAQFKAEDLEFLNEDFKLPDDFFSNVFEDEEFDFVQQMEQDVHTEQRVSDVQAEQKTRDMQTELSITEKQAMRNAQEKSKDAQAQKPVKDKQPIMRFAKTSKLQQTMRNSQMQKTMKDVVVQQTIEDTEKQTVMGKAEEKPEETNGDEKEPTGSLLFRMMDIENIKSAKRQNSTGQNKKLSKLPPKERNKQLQASLNKFLNQSRDS